MPRSEALLLQWALYDNKEYGQAFKQAKDLLDELEGDDLRDARRILGLACLRQQQYTQARLWLQKACHGSTWAEDWMHLAVAAALQADWALCEAAFDQVRFIQQMERYGQGAGFYRQLYWYASALCDGAAYERAQPLLEELAEAYRRVGTSDTAQLYVVGLPFWSSFLTLVERRFGEPGDYAAGVAWLHERMEAMDRDGRQQLHQAMRRLREAGGLSVEDEH